MLVRFQDLTSLSIEVEDGTKHAVRDILIDGGRLEAVLAVADVGGWFSGGTARIGLHRFREPDVANGLWPARVLQSDLQDAGGTYRVGPEAPGEAELRSAIDWTNSAGVEAEDGHVGTLMDLIFETGDWRVRHLVLGTGGETVPRHQRVVPADAIGGIDWPAGTVRLSGPASRVRESPDLHEFDGLEGKWYNKVLGYYGLG